MIEKKACVEVVEEVDSEFYTIFEYGEKFLRVVFFLIFLQSFAPDTGFPINGVWQGVKEAFECV